jgi:hypothetical protein
MKLLPISRRSRRWRGQFRYRGSRRDSAMAQFWNVDEMRRLTKKRYEDLAETYWLTREADY